MLSIDAALFPSIFSLGLVKSADVELATRRADCMWDAEFMLQYYAISFQELEHI